MTRVLLVWPEPIAHFTRSDSYRQVPAQLARRAEVVLATAGDTPLPPELVGGFASEARLSTDKRQFVLKGRERLEHLHRRTPFHRIVSAFDGRAITTAGALAARWRVPWLAVCEDHPFGERYRAAPDSALTHAKRLAHTLGLRYWLREATAAALFINPGVLEFLRLPHDKLRVFGNAVDFGAIPDVSNAKPVPARIGYVGYVNTDKGAILMAEALALVRERHPSATLALVGEVNPAARDRMLRECPEGIEFLGARPHDEALRELARCSLCWHAYRPLPWLCHNQVLKVLEYQALGRAVVSVDTPGTRDLVTDGEDGLLVPCDDPPALARATSDLLDDPARAASLAAAGRARVTSTRNWANVGPEFADFALGLAKA